MSKTAVFTIVSKNYWHFARVLTRSLEEHQPDWERFVILVDDVDGSLDLASERFTTVPVAFLPLPRMREFLFRYAILELNTAVKPWAFEYLFGRGYDRVIYLDPDIRVYSPLRELEEALETAFLVLTPHATDLLDRAKPNDLDIIRAGTYNLGFLGVTRRRPLEAFLDWWQGKLEFDCVIDFPNHLFVDQKWLDLAPGLFPDVVIFRDDTYNVAYWNLAHRPVVRSQAGRYTVNGRPLRFFHFSGINVWRPELLSKHQDRFDATSLGDCLHLLREYAQCAVDAGYARYCRLPYAFDSFANGVKIAAFLRSVVRHSSALQEALGADPFARAEYFNRPAREDDRARLPMTTAMSILWEIRQDLRDTFPDPWGTDRSAYAQWFVANARSYAGVDDYFVDPVRHRLQTDTADGGTEEGSARPRRLGPHRLVNSLRYRAGRILRPNPSALRATPAAPVPRATPTAARAELDSGLNIAGYWRSRTGVGEAARAAARAVRSAGIPFSLVDFDHDADSHKETPAGLEGARRGAAFNANLMFVNADVTPIVARALGDEFFRGRYTIGCWHWELPEFPDEWVASAQRLQEIWVPSAFVQEAVARKVSVPVVRMPHSVEVGPAAPVIRSDFGVPESRFLFLCLFDLLSVAERKNPAGVIEAFRRAFTADAPVALLVKVGHAEHRLDDFAALHELARRTPNVYLSGCALSRAETNGLLELADCVVSLHRSEGFGLILAEAMYLGKPTIATAWSGNMEFQTPDNACLVDYRIVELGRDHAPYRARDHWAEPDLDHAAHFMQRVAEDASFRERLGEAARHTIRTEFDPKTVGDRYRQRLSDLGLLRDGTSQAAASPAPSRETIEVKNARRGPAEAAPWDPNDAPAGAIPGAAVADQSLAAYLLARAALFSVPLLAFVLIFEFIFYRTGESWPISAVLKAHTQAGAGLHYRALFPPQFSLFKIPRLRQLKPEILVIGNSRTEAFRPFMFHPHEAKFYNGASLLNCLDDVVEYAKQVRRKRLPAPKVLILGIEYDWLCGSYADRKTDLNVWAQRDEALTPGGHVGAARTVLRSGKLIELFGVAIGPRRESPVVSPRFGVVPYVWSSGFRYTDGSYCVIGEVEGAKLGAPNPRLAPPSDEVLIRDRLSGEPAKAAFSPEALDILVASLVSLRDEGIEIYAYLPTFGNQAAAEFARRPLWLDLFAQCDARVPAKLGEVGIPCYRATSAADFGLDDQSMIDALHPGEVYSSYVLEGIVAMAPPGSHLASVDLEHLRALRRREGVHPMAFFPDEP
jgi:glycosyltransferase involved in cell wall biosynthesis